MRYIQILLLLVITSLTIGCEEALPQEFSDLIQPKFGFNKVLEGKEVDMTKVFDEPFVLTIDDTTQLNVAFKSSAFGEKLIVGDWSYNYEKAIKYKRYYFLHHLVDSSFYEVVVVGRYFSRFYGFENINRQNLFVHDLIIDSSKFCSLRPLRQELNETENVVVDPSEKKIIRQFYKGFFKGAYLKKAVSEVRTNKILEEIEVKYGTKELDIDEGVIIFPNPCRGNDVEVKSDLINADDFEVIVSDLAGKRIDCAQSPGFKSIKIETSTLVNGNYLVQVIAGKRQVSGQFVVLK